MHVSVSVSLWVVHALCVWVCAWMCIRMLAYTLFQFIIKEPKIVSGATLAAKTTTGYHHCFVFPVSLLNYWFLQTTPSCWEDKNNWGTQLLWQKSMHLSSQTRHSQQAINTCLLKREKSTTKQKLLKVSVLCCLYKMPEPLKHFELHQYRMPVWVCMHGHNGLSQLEFANVMDWPWGISILVFCTDDPNNWMRVAYLLFVSLAF